MAVLLHSQVTIFEGALRSGGMPADIELDDDGRFTLTKVDRSTRAATETVFDTSVQNLDVNPGTTYLDITANGVKKRVDFAGSDHIPFVLLGALGMELSRKAAERAGLKDWLAAFKERGVVRRFTTNDRTAVILGSAIVVIVAVIVLLVVMRFLG